MFHERKICNEFKPAWAFTFYMLYIDSVNNSRTWWWVIWKAEICRWGFWKYTAQSVLGCNFYAQRDEKHLYRMSQEECARLREGVPYVKVYRYNPEHLCPKLNGYGDNDQRKVWSSVGSTHCTCQLTILSMSVLECGVILWQFSCKAGTVFSTVM